MYILKFGPCKTISLGLSEVVVVSDALYFYACTDTDAYKLGLQLGPSLEELSWVWSLLPYYAYSSPW